MLTAHLSQKVARPSTVPKRLMRMMVAALGIALVVALPGAAAFACNEGTQTGCGSLHDGPPPETSSSERTFNSAVSTANQGTSHDHSTSGSVVSSAFAIVKLVYSPPSNPTYSCYTAYDSNGRSYQSCHWSH